MSGGAGSVTLWGVCLGALALGLLLWRLETITWRRVASLVALACLLVLALTSTDRLRQGAERTVLVTHGVRSETVQRLAASRQAAVVVLDDAVAATETPPEWRSVPDLETLERQEPGLERVSVTGYGPPSWSWARSRLAVGAFDPPQPAPGVLAVQWRRRLVLGDTLRVSGRAVAPRETCILRLSGPGAVATEAPLASEGATAFELADTPRAPGRYLYRLDLLCPEPRSAESTRGQDAGDTSEPAALGGGPEELLASELLDVEVREPALPALLWLESAPSFESREVKRWLGEAGGPMALRARISRDRFRSEVVGARGETAGGLPITPASILRLTPELLDQLDVVVADAAELRRLGAGEGEALRRAVVSGGLGLLLLPSRDLEELPEAWRLFEVRAFGDGGPLPMRVTWAGAAPAPALDVAAREIAEAPGIAPLVTLRGERVLAAVRAMGAGRVGLTLLDDTYRWLLEGERSAWTGFWSACLDALRRPTPGGRGWSVPEGPVLVGEPLELLLETAEAEPQAWLVYDGEEPRPLALRQDPLEPTRWSATLRPRAAGWYRVVANGSTEGRTEVFGPGETAGHDAWFWAQPPDAWRSWRHEHAVRAAALRAELTRPGIVSAAGSDPRRPQLPAVVRVLAGLVLLVALGLLWARGQGGRPTTAP